MQRACATSRVEGSGSLKGLTDPFEPSKSLLDCVIEAPIFGALFGLNIATAFLDAVEFAKLG